MLSLPADEEWQVSVIILHSLILHRSYEYDVLIITLPYQHFIYMKDCEHVVNGVYNYIIYLCSRDGKCHSASQTQPALRL